MVVGEYADRLLFQSSLGVKVAQFLRYVIVKDFRIVLVHYALERSERLILYAVCRAVPAHLAVCDPEREVGIRIILPVLEQFHLRAHILSLERLELNLELLYCRIELIIIPGPETPCKYAGGILFELIRVLNRCFQLFAAGKYAALEHSIRPGLYASISGKLLLVILRNFIGI